MQLPSIFGHSKGHECGFYVQAPKIEPQLISEVMALMLLHNLQALIIASSSCLPNMDSSNETLLLKSCPNNREGLGMVTAEITDYAEVLTCIFIFSRHKLSYGGICLVLAPSRIPAQIDYKERCYSNYDATSENDLMQHYTDNAE